MKILIDIDVLDRSDYPQHILSQLIRRNHIIEIVVQNCEQWQNRSYQGNSYLMTEDSGVLFCDVYVSYDFDKLRASRADYKILISSADNSQINNEVYFIDRAECATDIVELINNYDGG